MEKKELEDIIEKLELNVSKENGTFGLYYVDGEDACHIKANKDGFELFAIELLKAAKDIENVIENKEKNYIDFGFNRKWIQGDVIIAYIKPILEKRVEIIAEKAYVPAIKDDLFNFGCFALIGILILSLIVGVYTIITWF